MSRVELFLKRGCCSLFADLLRREKDKAASLARNYIWQVSTIQSEIKLLRDAVKVFDSDVDLETFKPRHE